MDFFQAQAHAQRRTKWLVLLFIASIGATIATTYLAIIFITGQLPKGSSSNRNHSYTYDYEQSSPDSPTAIATAWWDPQLFAWVAGGTILLVASAALFKSAQLRRGGAAIAEMVGGRRIEPNTTDLKEKRLVNVIEEMSIASGIPVPAVYVLDEETGLNAFAAGLTTNDAVIAVTRGTLEKLNRDELQGVVAHEFSHILNGDMRMNIRLVAVLFGIFFLTLIGRGLLRALTYSGGRDRKRDGRILIVVAAIGLALVVIGYIGYFFGRIIQAAVSRQREFLADASAVQFTRNPGGITGALKKIGGYALGARVNNNKAAAIGHFFFAEGGLSNFFGLLATHPPLDTRIRAIDPQFDGKYFDAPETIDVTKESFVSAGLVPPLPTPKRTLTPLRNAQPATALASIGTLTPEQVNNAQALIDGLPFALRQAARLSTQAPALIYALLLDDRPEICDQQLAALPADAAAFIHAQAEPLSQLQPAHKLPLCQLALPTLRELTAEAQAELFAMIKVLIEGDGHVSTFEFALQKLLQRQLLLSRAPRLMPGEQLYSFQAVREELVLVLSAVAHAGAETSGQAQTAYAVGTQLLKTLEGPLMLLAPEMCTPAKLDPALNRLATAAGPIKQRLLLACAAAATVDGELRIAEAELLRAIAALLDCPMPPLTLAK